MKPRFTDAASLTRISSLSDGVFAIVFTLLVFDLKISPGVGGEFLSIAILQLQPKLLSYFVTFFIIGVYWVGHHAILRHVIAYDRGFLWMNLLFLMSVSFLPFPSSLLGMYGAEQVAVVIYGLSIISTGILLSLLWRHAATGHYLIDEKLDPQVIRMGHRRIMAAPTVALLSICVSYWDAEYSIVLYLIAGLIYTLPTRIDRLHYQGKLKD